MFRIRNQIRNNLKQKSKLIRNELKFERNIGEILTEYVKKFKFLCISQFKPILINIL